MKYSQTIWCNLYKNYQQLKKCDGCIYDKDCKYRNSGALRKIKVRES